MTPESMEFRGCYLHPTRPAVRNCINCERPICTLCEEESGDPLLCPPCKEELEQEEPSGVAVPFTRDDLNVAERPSAPFQVGELTVFQDGRVLAPREQEAAAPSAEQPPGRAGETAPSEVSAKAEESGGGTERKPADRKKTRRRLPPEMRTIHQAEAPVEHREAREAADAGETRGTTTARARKERAAEAELKKRTGPAAQVLNGLPFGIVTAIAVSGVWLLFAFLAKQWSQIAIFTLGIAVPWAFYKGTTVRKYAGVPIWTEPSKPLWIAIPSLVIVAALVVPLQLLAFKMIYGSNPAKLPFGDFVERFFKVPDWILLICGLLLAFCVPFLLRAGAGWSKPARKREKLAGGEAEEEQEPEAEAAPEP
ncbi:MAG: hypothetical protein ACYC99_10545 [Candidatus Geothermincolia bacterium]